MAKIRRQAVNVLDIVEKFTNFALKDQMSKSAISVPSNIAEGHGGNSNGDLARFLNIGKESNGDLRTRVYIVQKRISTIQNQQNS
ncbi:MAG: four helix bundle protein [Rubritalea sp.]|uniref:four helix bundle protein n=1 Tax=Rubritalea sp. TaxID=2109375 RepID=UPI0032423470